MYGPATQAPRGWAGSGRGPTFLLRGCGQGGCSGEIAALGMRAGTARLASLLGCWLGDASWCVPVCVCVYLCVCRPERKEKFPSKGGICQFSKILLRIW